MALIEIDITKLIPAVVKIAVRDTLVDFVSDQAKKYASDEIAGKIKKLRSDAAFNEKFEAGLQRAAQRFIEEYELEDEDLVAVIAADAHFFENEEVQAALLAVLKKPGAYLVEERAQIIQSFESVFPNRRNRQRVDRAVTYLLKCLAEELWHLPELQPIYSLQFQRITAEGTRQQVELQKAQLLALTDLNVGVREALVQLTDAIVEQKLLPAGDAPALPGPASRPKVFHNLPHPDYGRFIGREKELGQVYRILRPYPHSQHALVTIDGIGGIGKSALALEIAHRYLRNYDRIPEEERFEAIIWASAKQTVLTSEGIVTRNQALRTLDDIYTTIAVALQREDITRARPEEQAEVTRNALTRQRTLLIVDNLETVDDEDVMTFLRELPAPTKAIVTTRHRLDVAYPVRLTGMPWADARRLITQECEKKRVTLTKGETRKLYDRTGGVPLALVWSISQLGFGYGTEVVLRRLGEPTNDIARFCFSETLQAIHEKVSFRLLMALSVFTIDATRNALRFAANISEIGCDEGLVELEKLSLVNRFGDRFSLLPLTKTFSLMELSKDPDLEVTLKTRIADFYTKFLADLYPNREKNIKAVQPEYENLISVLDYCYRQDPKKFSKLTFLCYYYYWAVGRWGILIEYLKKDIDISILSNDTRTQAFSWLRLSGIHLYQGDLTKAKKAVLKSMDISKKNDHTYALGFGYSRLAAIYRDGEIYDHAKESVETGLLLAEKLKKSNLTSRLHLVYGGLSVEQENYRKAEELLEALSTIVEDESTLSSWWYRLRGEAALGLQAFNKAENFLMRSLEIARIRKSKQNQAHTLLSLAKLEFEKGNTEKSQLLLDEAYEQIKKLDLKVWLKKANKLQNQIVTKIP